MPSLWTVETLVLPTQYTPLTIHYATIIVNQGYPTKSNRVCRGQLNGSVDSNNGELFKRFYLGRFNKFILNFGMEYILMS